MSKLSARKRRVKRTVSIGKVAPEAVGQVEDLDGRIEAIQWLIPLGLKAVTEELQRAVVELAGPRYERKGSDQPLRRWGSQPGSVYLGDQKLPVDVPRVRNVGSDTEVPLRAYQALQTPRQIDEGLLLRMLKGIATRNYEACADTVPEAFGLSRSSVSRRYVKGSARKLAEFQERSLEGYDLVALFLDGKSFADEEIIIALGVTLDGQKIPLGFVQAATKALAALKPSLELMNQSALHRLEEGLEETLTLHRLGLTPMLKDSFRTTNCIENVNSLLAQLTHNVRRWTNSSQRHRWVATALLDIEPRLRRVRGFHHLPMLRQAIQAELGIKQLAMTG